MFATIVSMLRPALGRFLSGRARRVGATTVGATGLLSACLKNKRGEDKRGERGSRGISRWYTYSVQVTPRRVLANGERRSARVLAYGRYIHAPAGANNDELGDGTWPGYV